MAAITWNKWANIIVTNMVIGDAMAAALDPDVGGNQTFSVYGMPLRKISDATLAWATGTPLRQTGLEVIEAFKLGQLHPGIAARGVTQQDIDGALPVFTIEAGERAQYENRLLAFIAEQGYEVISQEV